MLNNEHYSRISDTNKIQISVTGSERLNDHALVDHIQQIRSITALPNEHFQKLYIEPIEQFLAYTQHIPNKIIAEHFRFVMRTLKHRRAVILPAQGDTETVTEQKDLWTYVLFVAALMQRFSRKMSYTIVYRRPNVPSQNQWNPFNGPIPSGCYFYIDCNRQLPTDSTASFLSLIFEAPCLAWLFDDEKAFYTLINTLNVFDTSNPTSHLVSTILFPQADQEQHSIDNTNLNTGCMEADTEKQNLKEQPELSGDSFFHWLTVTFDQNPDQFKNCFHQTLNGPAFLIPQIFDLFVKTMGVGNAQRIQAQCLRSKEVHSILETVNVPGIGKTKAILFPELK